MKAPATAIVAADVKFYENFARTFPTRPEMADRFRAPEQAEATKGFARDNALLQMGYFILAARALGLDCGPMAASTARRSMRSSSRRPADLALPDQHRLPRRFERLSAPAAPRARRNRILYLTAAWA